MVSISARRLLAHPCPQEDVVVEAERDQEDEGIQRHRHVGAGEAEHLVVDDHADAKRCGERQDHRGDQQQRRDDRPKQCCQNPGAIRLG
jgi:hypothetical protein